MRFKEITATGNSAKMRDHEYRSVIKEYLLNRVAAPDKFQYIGLRELVHDPQLAAYRTKLNIWFQSAPHRFRKHLIGRILDETSSNHSSALSELFLYRLFSSWGWWVEPEPKDYACVPDFFVETPSGESFFCEVTQLHRGVKAEGARKPFFALLNRLNKFNTDFLLAVDLHEWSTEIDIPKLTNHIWLWLDTCRPKHQPGIPWTFMISVSMAA